MNNDRFNFRAWDVKNNCMCSVGELAWCQGGLKAYGPGHSIGDSWVMDDSIILMQRAGLEDKHGTLIYEGDIVESGIGDFIIKWVDSKKSFWPVMVENQDDLDELTWQDFLENTSELEIIGNIYENKKDDSITGRT